VQIFQIQVYLCEGFSDLKLTTDLGPLYGSLPAPSRLPMLITDPQAQRRPLPSPEELPCSDDTPVDNEDQNLLPNLLLTTLYRIWQQRQDWFFAVDMALYHTAGANPRVPIVPDAFLSLGVERKKNGKSRRSYAVWAEGGVVPSFVLEMVSFQAREEYGEKFHLYAKLGVLYYVVYNPEFWQRDHHDPLEVYRLEGGGYQRQSGEPVWMPEIGLGIGRATQAYLGMEQEMLLWCDDTGRVHAPPEVSREELLREQRRSQRERLRADQEQRRATAAEHQAQKLADYLRSLGVDPDNLPNSDSNP